MMMEQHLHQGFHYNKLWKTIFYYRNIEHSYKYISSVRDLTQPHVIPNPNQDLDFHGHNL